MKRSAPPDRPHPRTAEKKKGRIDPNRDRALSRAPRPPSTLPAALTTAAHCSGKVELARPGNWPHGHNGQFPVIASSTSKTATARPECAACKVWWARRFPSITAVHSLAGLEVTTKSVERTAEAIGADIAQSEEDEIRKIVRLDLPIIVGEPVPILYVQKWTGQAYR